MPDLNRSLTLLADGTQVSGFRHAWLSGRDALGLLPMPFMLRVWNLSDDGYYALSAARYLSVLHGDSVLAAGKVSDVYRHIVPEGTVTEVIFSAGLDLWEAKVSLSVEAGTAVSETVRRILAASGTGIPLLSFPGEDPVRSRAQALSGRAAECVLEALSAVPARCVLTPSGLSVIPSAGLPVSMVLTEKDLMVPPSFVSGDRMVLRTNSLGWPLGKTVSIRWEEKSETGLVAERSLDADNMEGEWQAELLIERC